MERLTTDNPKDNIQTALNLFYAKDGWTWVMGGGPAPEYHDVSLCDYVRSMVKAHTPDADIPSDDDEMSCLMAEWLFDGTDTVEGLIATLYTAGWAFAELRHRLKAYEDTGLEPEDISRAFNEVSSAKLAAQLLGTTPERLAELVGADKAGRLVIIPEPEEGLERDLLEPMKVGYALKSEVVKFNMHLARDQKSVSHLDYTIIAALQAVLEGGGSDG